MSELKHNSMKDKNGKEISEGDVCRVAKPNGAFYVVVRGNYGLAAIQKDGVIEGVKERLDSHFCKRCEVVGNIFDNPELLETEEQKDDEN